MEVIMKKKNIFLIVLSCIFLIGIVCTIAGIQMGGKLFSFRLNKNTDSEKYRSSGSTTLSKSDTAGLKGLDFDFNAQNVIITFSDKPDYRIEGDTNSETKYNSYIKNGVWHIDTPKSQKATITILDHTVQIPWHSDLDINDLFNGGDDDEDSSSEKTCRISIPASTTLDSTRISIAAGECHIRGNMKTGNATLKVGAGSLDVEQLMAQTLKIKVGAGECIVQKVDITKQCTAKVGVGNLELGNSDSPAADSCIHNLSSKTAVGNTDIYSKLTGQSNLKCATGNLELNLAGTKANYSFDSNSSMGDIKFEKSKSASVKNNEQDIYGDISLHCSLGNINVDFDN